MAAVKNEGKDHVHASAHTILFAQLACTQNLKSNSRFVYFNQMAQPTILKDLIETTLEECIEIKGR